MLRTLAAPVHVLTFRKFAGGGITLLRFWSEGNVLHSQLCGAQSSKTQEGAHT